MGHIFLLMGKSASGKDAICRNLLQDERLKLCKVVGYTTRPMRRGEEQGKQYHFTDEAGFLSFYEKGCVIEARGYQTKRGLWRYFTADDGQIDLEKGSYLMIGTIEAYLALRDYFGKEKVTPLYIEADDGLRLERALKRERRQEVPRYDEMCRRYLADAEDFSDERLAAAGITEIFVNNDTLEECLSQVSSRILNQTEE